MTRLRDDQTGGEGRGVRIPVGIGAGFCGYPCGDICDGTATTTRRSDDEATTRRRRRRDDALCVVRQLAELLRLPFEEVYSDFDAICPRNWQRKGVTGQQIREFCEWRKAPLFIASIGARGRSPPSRSFGTGRSGRKSWSPGTSGRRTCSWQGHQPRVAMRHEYPEDAEALEAWMTKLDLIG